MKNIFIVLLFINLYAQNLQYTEIIKIYPTTNHIPANILRFYITFSSPIKETNILKHISLKNEFNKNISDVFFENQHEIWNKNNTEVLIIIDPGRIKKGLFAHNTMGWAFKPGEKYSLYVDSLITDINQNHIKSGYYKEFLAVEADTIPPQIKNWKLLLPNSKTKKPIIINFNDNINHISAFTYIKVLNKNKKIVKGKINLEKFETQWIFIPKKKWKKSIYYLIINNNLEDISANNLKGLFDNKYNSQMDVTNDKYILLNIK